MNHPDPTERLMRDDVLAMLSGDPLSRYVGARRAACFPEEADIEVSEVQAWTLTPRGTWEREEGEWQTENLRWQQEIPQPPSNQEANPVVAGVGAIAPDVARWIEYFSKQVDTAVAAVRREYDERLTRVEAALAERQATVLRGDELLTDAIAQLSAKLGADFEAEISDEEAAELWKLVDFSVEDEEE